MSIQDFFNNCENDLELVNSCSINWSVKGTGFGNLQIYIGQDGKTMIANEGMGKKFIKKILCDLVDLATLEDAILDKKVCDNKIHGSCPLHNIHCAYPICEEDSCIAR
jgi:hypothetical protein